MTDKRFYQIAAAEVAQGQIDQALWIKVTTDMAGENNIIRQARYIQLRAQEISLNESAATIGRATTSAADMGKKLFKWAVVVIVVGTAATLFFAATDKVDSVITLRQEIGNSVVTANAYASDGDSSKYEEFIGNIHNDCEYFSGIDKKAFLTSFEGSSQEMARTSSYCSQANNIYEHIQTQRDDFNRIVDNHARCMQDPRMICSPETEQELGWVLNGWSLSNMPTINLIP